VIDTNQIRAIVIAEKASAISSDSTSDLGKQRGMALDFYLGDLGEYMPVLEGQTSASSSDVSDTIETMLPALMDIFTSGEEYCEFSPQGPEDVEAARQETDYVNHVFMHENPGFLILYSQIKDALLSKNGIVKAWWEENETAEKETYKNLDESGYAAIAADADAEIVQQTATTEGDETRYDVVVRKSYKRGCFKAAAVPPEEFGIAKRARDIPSSSYCCHTYRKSASELIEEGYPKEVIDDLPAAGEDTSAENTARNTFDNETGPSSIVNKAMRLIEVTEHYVRLDVDEDGVAELVKVITAGSGNVLLGDAEELDRMPFHSITPYPMPHRFIGRSVADLTIDIMRIKTHLLRALLDNASLLNNQRIAVGSDGADENTLDDLLTNRPGGLVRMRNVEQLRPIPNTQLGGHILPLIEYVDQSRETRTGVTRHTGGIDPDVLNKASQTATGFQGLLDQSMMRIKLIARIFAETGIKDLFLHIHELLRKHQDEQKVMRLRNKWVPVDPREWKTRADMTVNVALGSGSKQQQLVLLNAILERQVQAIETQGGANGPLVTLENVYNTLKRMTELAGFRDVDSYFTQPDPEQEFETPPDPKMAEIQGKMQLEQARLQMQGQSEQAKAAMSAQSAQADMELKREEAGLKLQLMREEASAKLDLARETKAAELELARQSKSAEIELAREQMLIEAELGRERAALDASVKANISENRPGGDLSA